MGKIGTEVLTKKELLRRGREVDYSRLPDVEVVRHGGKGRYARTVKIFGGAGPRISTNGVCYYLPPISTPFVNWLRKFYRNNGVDLVKVFADAGYAVRSSYVGRLWCVNRRINLLAQKIERLQNRDEFLEAVPPTTPPFQVAELLKLYEKF